MNKKSLHKKYFRGIDPFGSYCVSNKRFNNFEFACRYAYAIKSIVRYIPLDQSYIDWYRKYILPSQRKMKKMERSHKKAVSNALMILKS